MGTSKLLKEPELRPNLVASTGEQTVGLVIRNLVVLLTADTCDLRQPITPSAARGYFELVAEMMYVCSYNRLNMDTEALNVIELDFTRCDLLSSCDALGISDEAWIHASELLGSQADQYSHWSIVVPEGSGCDRSWAALAQELLHNFGIYHGSRDSVEEGLCECHQLRSCWRDSCHQEYGDFSTCMGYGDACPSAVESYRLDWAEAVAVMKESNFDVGQWRALDVYATYVGPDSIVIVKPDWLGDDYQYNLYFSLRVNKRGDKNLASEFVGKVSVHSIDERVDAQTSNENGNIHLLKVVDANAMHIFTGLNLVLKVGSFRVDDSISMIFCRYVDDPETECARPVGGDAVLYTSGGDDSDCIFRIAGSGGVSPFAGDCGRAGDNGPDPADPASGTIRGLVMLPSGDLLAAVDTRLTLLASGLLKVFDANSAADRDVELPVTVKGLAADESGIYVSAQSCILLLDPATFEEVEVLGSCAVAGSRNGAGADALFDDIGGIALDSVQGLLYVSETETHCIRVVNSAFEVQAFAGACGANNNGSAGGSRPEASFSSPRGIAVDPSQGAVLVADTGNHCIRRIAPQGSVITLAGECGSEGSEDGLSTKARFSKPHAVAVDPSTGLIYVSQMDGCIRTINTLTDEVSTIPGTCDSGTDSFYLVVGEAVHPLTLPRRSHHHHSTHPRLPIPSTGPLGLPWSTPAPGPPGAWPPP
eukprot:gene27716-7361_t